MKEVEESVKEVEESASEKDARQVRGDGGG